MSAVLVFGSKVAGEVVMLRQHVEPIFKSLGRPLHDNGAILGEDLPEVIRELEMLLESGMEMEDKKDEPVNELEEQEDEKAERNADTISLKKRFYPLLDLMRKAQAKGEALHWRPL